MITTSTLREMKATLKKITVLTAYDSVTAGILAGAGIDIILVGDSLGNAVLGYDNTIPVTMEEMLHHTKAVVRGAQGAFVVADMPFMSYQVSPEEALRNASRFIKEAGANAVKLESVKYLDAIKKIVDAGIPVMGHIGFTPQSVNQLGGYRVQGRGLMDVKELVDNAKALENAGAFSLVLEMVPAGTGEKVSRSVSIPVIGCGAGPYCDGQVLVINDVIGLSGDDMPKFAKKYADVAAVIRQAVLNYSKEVKSGAFPGKENSF
jgi:3-methyl-2-oxobutanoate hydroxymethyltransferase